MKLCQVLGGYHPTSGVPEQKQGEKMMRTGRQNAKSRGEVVALRNSLEMVKYGMAVRESDGELAARLESRGSRGLRVAWMQPGGAAENAGIRCGDIVLEVNYTITHSLCEFEKAVASSRSDGSHRFLLQRVGTSGFVECWIDDLRQDYDKPFRYVRGPIRERNGK